jgi:hypothetical protein
MDILGDELEVKTVTVPKIVKGFTKADNRLFWQGVHLTVDAKWVYLTLVSFRHSKTKATFPSYDKIIERSGLTRVRVSRGIAELEHFLWIGKEKRFNGSNRYELTFPIRYKLSPRGEKEGLADDQTCPTKFEAEQWANRHKRKRTAVFIAPNDVRMDEIPF